MEANRATEILTQRLAELSELPPDYDSPDLKVWRKKTELSLRRIFGDDHHLVVEFQGIHFLMHYEGTAEQLQEDFEYGRTGASALLKGAIYDLEELTEPVEFAQDSAIDPELWEHVRRLVEQEQWAQVASQTAIFVESKVREWARRPDSETTTHLMTVVLKPDGGVFPLGRTDPEAEGWHQLGRGFMGAVRNVATHRIERRDDAKRWALGVLGAGSLLLTQLRHQHANSFRS